LKRVVLFFSEDELMIPGSRNILKKRSNQIWLTFIFAETKKWWNKDVKKNQVLSKSISISSNFIPSIFSCLQKVKKTNKENVRFLKNLGWSQVFGVENKFQEKYFCLLTFSNFLKQVSSEREKSDSAWVQFLLKITRTSIKLPSTLKNET